MGKDSSHPMLGLRQARAPGMRMGDRSTPMYGSPDKIAKLEKLASLRQKEAWPGYKNIADFHGGIYESGHVSPYTRGAGNCDSPVFLLLQDWGSENFLHELTDEERNTLAALGRAPGLETNKNLSALLSEWLGMKLDTCYATNLLPFVKPGRMSESVPEVVLRRAAKEFAVPQIQIVRPRQVICLGRAVFRSVRHAVGLTLGSRLTVGQSFVWEGIRIWRQAHPGGLGAASRGGLQGLRDDWAAMTAEPSFEI